MPTSTQVPLRAPLPVPLVCHLALCQCHISITSLGHRLDLGEVEVVQRLTPRWGILVWKIGHSSKGAGLPSLWVAVDSLGDQPRHHTMHSQRHLEGADMVLRCKDPRLTHLDISRKGK